MASTTLITFLLQAPTSVFSVEILGSWDNFSKPYQLKRDRKTGPGQWRGCHTFENITCDGDILNASTSRDGGLKMGGTYWYYYVLDGDTEYHDPAEPSTNQCPLLPGQMVNVLDVPVQGKVFFGGSRNVSSSSLDSVVFTLDPQDKYLPSGVRRASTTSAAHARKARHTLKTKSMVRAQLNGFTGPETVPQTSHTYQDVLTLNRHRSLLSVFYRMRQTRSAGSIAKSHLTWPRKVFSRAGQPTQQEVPDPVPEMKELPGRALSPSPTSIWDGFVLPVSVPSPAVTTYRAPTALKVNLSESRSSVCPLEQLSSSDHRSSIPPIEGERGLDGGHTTSSARSSETSFLSSYYTPLEQFRKTSYFCPNPADENDTLALSDCFGQLGLAPEAIQRLTDPTKTHSNHQPAYPEVVSSTESPGSHELDFHSPKSGYAESLASNAASANFSPCLASNTTHSGLMSPCHLSQPETPIMSEFGDEMLPTLRTSESLAQMGRRTSSDLDFAVAKVSSRAGPPHQPPPHTHYTQTSHAPLGGFQGYSLPSHDHSSVLTIRKLPSLTTFETTNGNPPFAEQNGVSKQDLVRSWNDGSEHHMSALGELVDDLGYLGELII